MVVRWTGLEEVIDKRAIDLTVVHGIVIERFTGRVHNFGFECSWDHDGCAELMLRGCCH